MGANTMSSKSRLQAIVDLKKIIELTEGGQIITLNIGVISKNEHQIARVYGSEILNETHTIVPSVTLINNNGKVNELSALTTLVY